MHETDKKYKLVDGIIVPQYFAYYLASRKTTGLKLLALSST
jgi:hypothetical protein